MSFLLKAVSLIQNMKNGIIINKLSRVEIHLTRLEQIIPLSFEEYEKDWKSQMIAERILQILVEIIIDTANRIIALKGWGPVASSSEAVRLLAEKGVIPSEAPYHKMVKFRNFIVHAYDKIDSEIVYSILKNDLEDIRNFRDRILEYE